MHELSIAQGIIEIVEETARAHGICAVRRVHVKIGELAGVDPEALLFAWESATREGIACGSELEIERTPGKAWCTDCGKIVPLKQYGDPCPDCGGYRLIANGGTEMRVVDIVPDEKPENHF